MRRLLSGAALAAFLAGLLPLAASAAEPESGALSILFENDIFFKTDRHYTNGVGLAYTTSPQDTAQWAVDLAHALPFFPKHGEVRTTFELGQDMFTPQNTALANPDPTDRPYAGFLFGAIGVLSKSDSHLDQLRLQLGVVGPDSLAEETQIWVHSLLNDRKPAGWSFQLHNEPAVELTYERSLKIIPPKSFLGIFFDAEPHVGMAVGNVYDYFNAGLMGRAGINLPDDFGPLRLDPGLPGSSFFEPTGVISAYVFAGVDGRAVGRNIFLDGNSFQASRSVDKNILVGDLQFGAAVAFKAWRVTFTHVFRTKEFRTQTSADQFGAVSLTFRF